MKTKEKKYVILGDNNFWYSQFTASTKKEIDEYIDDVKQGILHKDYDNSLAMQLFVYEITEIERISI